jgi:hypothetical protein
VPDSAQDQKARPVISEQSWEDAQLLWDYHQMHHESRPCSVAIGLGSHDLDVADTAVDLYKRGPDLDDPASDTMKIVTETCMEAVALNRCGSIVPGCAGMAPLGPALSRQVGAQVIDGVTAAVKLVESLVSLGLRTSKQGEYAAPHPKKHSGLLSEFTI